MITHEYLKEVLHYNKDTGIFTWKQSRANNKIKVEDVAGCLHLSGYIIISINNKSYKAHRLAWLYIYGKWPQNHIDHINGIRDDNRIENLRDITRRENGQNRIEHRNGRLVGCNFNKSAQKWRAQIRINTKRKTLGYYNTELEANEAYIAMGWLLSEVKQL